MATSASIQVQSADPATGEAAVYQPAENWSSKWALDHALENFRNAENFRTVNHDWRWRNADELYLAFQAQKFWENTRIPRSNIGIYVCLEQIESFLPKIVSAIFADGASWFEAFPRPNSTMAEARATRDLLTYHLESNHERPGESVREVFRRAIKSSAIYGNGIVEIGYRHQSIKRRRLVRDFRPRRVRIDLSSLGIPVSGNLPTGQYDSRIREIQYTDTEDRPFIQYIPLQDFYIDPNCQSPFVQDARYCAKRVYMTVDELVAVRENETSGDFGFTIPGDSELVELAQHKPYAQADWTKSTSETIRSGFWQPNTDQDSNPAGKRVEVIVYWEADRLVWIANRKQLFLNVANPYAFMPFFDCFYVDVLNRFYGLSICDVLEGEQRLIQSIINARVDELALNIHAPLVKRRGLIIPAYQLRVRPGQITEADDPERDIIRREPSNITAQAFVEVDAAERRAQRYTGITDLATLGAPSSGGNSAARTATGVNTQAQATATRLQYLVENSEDTFVEPILAALHTLEKRFLPPDQYTQILGDDGKLLAVDHLDVINAEVKFSMRASAKMQSRANMLQIFPLIEQTILNPEFLQLVAQQQGMTINMQEFEAMLGDALGRRVERQLFVPMTPEQQAAMNQPPPEAQAKLAQQQQRTQGQIQIQAMKSAQEQRMKAQQNVHEAGMQEDQQSHEFSQTLAENILKHLQQLSAADQAAPTEQASAFPGAETP